MHVGTCCICGRIRLVDFVGCTGDEMCVDCFKLVQVMLPVFEQAIQKCIDDTIKISKLELN